MWERYLIVLIEKWYEGFNLKMFWTIISNRFIQSIFLYDCSKCKQMDINDLGLGVVNVVCGMSNYAYLKGNIFIYA